MTAAGGAGRLSGRVAIVTGGAHGIGRAYVRRLGEEGAAVVIADIDGDAAALLAEELGAKGIEALALATDVGDEASTRAMAAATLARFARIDVLVNNAAIFKSVPYQRGGFESITFAEFERVLRVNVIGVWACCVAVVPAMRAQGYGKIINISSTRALRSPPGRPGGIQYASSKSALLAMTRDLAREVGADGIRVNCLAPGSTLSDDDLSASDIEAARARPQTTERALAAPETADDLVGTLVFLASADSDFVTGQTIVVDGGSHMA